MDGYMDGWVGGCKDAWMDGLDGWMDGLIDGWIDVAICRHVYGKGLARGE